MERASRLAPVATGLFVAGTAAAALSLAVLNQVTIRAALSSFFVVTLTAALSFGTAGVLIALKRPDLRIGRMLCAVAVATSIPPATAQYARYALVTHPGGLPAGRFAAWLTVWDWPLGYSLVLVGVALVFPDVQRLSRRERLLAWLAATAAALMMAGNAVSPQPNIALPQVPNPYGIAAARSLGSAGTAAGTLLLLAAMIAAFAGLIGRYRRGTERQRQQLRWFLLAFGLLVAVEALVHVAGFVLFPNPSDSAVLGWAEAAAVPWLVVAIGIAVLRHQLYDIDIVVNRTLVYLVMSGLVVGSYILVVGYLGAGLKVHGTGVALVAAGLVAVAFHPVRARVQLAVNRLLYGRRDEPYAVLTELGRRLEATVSPDAVLTTIAASMRDALRVPYAAVTLGDAAGTLPGAQAGTPAPVALRVPLVFGAEQVGELAVAARQPGEPLGAADRRLLADFGRQAGAAVHAARLTTDLMAAQERLVTAREEERRRLRRDLHDGLGPHLASQALTLDAVRGLLHRDPAAADAVLVELREQTQQAVADIRRIVNDLRPATLDQGLVAAMRDHATRYAQTGLEVSVQAPGELPPLTAAVELAAYRIAAEAVTNTARHARAKRCLVSLTADPPSGLLRLEISDDGSGFPDGYQPHVGLPTMQARALELGGQCSIDSKPGSGTHVVAQLPLAVEAG